MLFGVAVGLYNQQTLKQHQLSPYLHHHSPITTYMAYSLEIRQKALAYDDKCKNIDLVIEAFGVSRHTVFRWRRQLKETGNLSCKKPTNRPRKFDRKELLA
ncbi:hypothetical protein DQF64_12510 [Moraxella bovis]|nr:hypothetical protein DQF64_12510 [Moraxella bovis]